MSQNEIRIPAEVHNYLWTRYLPETTYKMYLLVGYLKSNGIVGDKATQILMNSKIEDEVHSSAQMEQILAEKKRLIEKFGFVYPTNHQEDIDLLINYKLITKGQTSDGQDLYDFVLPVPRPESVLNFDEEEKKSLQNIVFEIKHQNTLNGILTLLVNSNGNVTAPVSHLENTIKTKISEIRSVLEFLVEEGSIKVIAAKPLSALKKNDRIQIKIVKEVFETKRVVME